MQPFDYRIAVQDPLQMALAGYQQGQQFQQQRVQGEREAQLYDMEMQQYQANQAKLQEEQARAKQVQANLADMFERVDTGTLPEGYIGRFLAENPEVGEQTAAYLQGISEEQKMTGVRDQTRLLMMLNNEPGTPSEDSQVAMLLKERKAAAEAAGKPDQAAAAEASLMEYLNSPAALKASLMTNIAIGSPEAWKVIEPLVVKKPVERELVTTEEGVFAADLSAEDVMGGMQRLGAAPAKSPLVSIGGEPTGVDATDAAFREKLGATVATEVGTLRTGSLAANRNLTILSQLETELANAPGGVEAGIKLFAGGLGIPSEGINELQAADAIISSLIPKQREEGSGSSSDKDVESFKKSLPSLLQTPEGRRKIIRNLRALNDYAVKEGAIANKLISGEFTIPQYNAALAALGSPLAPSGGGGATPGRRRFDAQGREIK
jgi:hypothetical protein